MKPRIALRVRRDEHMAHVLEIPDDVYDIPRQYADETGQSIDTLVGTWARGLSERLRRAKSHREHPLDWQTATAEDIIADLRGKSRCAGLRCGLMTQYLLDTDSSICSSERLHSHHSAFW